MNIAMEELAPLVSKVCVLRQKAPLEVSREKRHLLELLEKRHKRYLEKKSCEALEPDVPHSKFIEGGLDNGLDSFTEHVVKRAQERRMRRRRHQTSLNALPQSLAQSKTSASPRMQTVGAALELVGSYDSSQQPCFPRPAWQSPRTKLASKEKGMSLLPDCHKLSRSCKSASLPHLATPVKEHIREMCRTTLKRTPLAAAVACHSSLERSNEESMGVSSASTVKVKRNLFSGGNGNDVDLGVSHYNDTCCGSGVVSGSADVPMAGTSFWSKEGQESQRQKCAVVYLSERHSRLCPVTHVPMVPPVTPEPGQAKDVRYIQALHDCKSQRALKALLKAIEGKRAREVQKTEMARVAAEREKQMDSIARIKAQQRVEIYALNAKMRELEEANFKAMKDAKV